MIRRGSRVFLVFVQRGVEGEAAWQMVRESLDCLSEGRLTKNIISVEYFFAKSDASLAYWINCSYVRVLSFSAGALI